MAKRFSLEAIFSAVDHFTRPITKMESTVAGAAKRISKGLAGVDRVNSRISAGLQQVATVGAGAGIAMGVAANHVIGAGAEFEQAIADVGAVSLQSRDQIADLERKALELGASTKFSATEVAKGMEEMGRAGFDTSQILDGISGMLNAAAAEGGDLAEITETVSKVMKGMGLEMTETNRVADVLALASAKTNSSIMSLGESMANVSATAHQFKVPLEDTVASVALLQDVGIDASEAGTAVATMLTKLAKPSKDAAAQMADMGIKFQDASGNMLPLAQIFGQFEKAAKKSGGNMKTAAFFAELVGLRGQKAAINLKALFESGKFSKLSDELLNAAGSAEKMASLRMDTFKGDVEQLGGAVETVQIKLFALQSGPLRDVVQGMTRWIQENRILIATRVQDTLAVIIAHLAEIWMWTKRVAAAVIVFYAWQLAVTAAAVATEVFSFAMEVLAFVTNRQRLFTIATTAATWISNAAMVAYTAVVWLGQAAIFAYGIVTGRQSALMVAGKAIYVLTGAAAIAYNAIVGAGTFLLTIYNTVTSLSAMRQAALTAVVWLAVAAQTALNLVMSLNPAVLVGIAVVGLIALVLKLSGGWDFLKGKISAFAGTVMSKIQPVIDKVMAFYNAVKKAASAAAGLLGLTPPTPGGSNTPEGFSRVPDNDSLPLVTPSDGVSKTVEENNFVSRADLTIKDETSRAQLDTSSLGPGFGINLAPSGGFRPAPAR